MTIRTDTSIAPYRMSIERAMFLQTSLLQRNGWTKQCIDRACGNIGRTTYFPARSRPKHRSAEKLELSRSQGNSRLGPFTGGRTGALDSIEIGWPVAVATGRASTLDGMDDVLRAEDVAMLGGERYVSTDGGGPVHGNPDHPSGISKVAADGTTTLVADRSAYLRKSRQDRAFR